MWMCQSLVLLALCIAAAGPARAEERPASWAKTIDIQGLPNLHKVSEKLYRSAQPTAEGMRNAKKLGIKTVVSLRAFHTDQDEIGNTGLGYERLSFKTWHPEQEDVVKFLKVVSDPARGPVLLHCQHGADRTGMMSAIYRIVVQGWTKEEAVREMTKGEFGFHEVWKNLPPWIMGLDIETLRKEAGLTPPSTAR